MKIRYTFFIAISLIFVITLGVISTLLFSKKFTTSTFQEPTKPIKTFIQKNHDHQNWTESTFIEHMIPHHEEAINQSKMMLTKTQNSKYQAILNNITEVQTGEVAEMKQWYQEWNSKPYEDKRVYEPMMTDIYSYTGRKLEREWLQSMVYHHQAAIYIAQSGLKTIHKEELRSLMESIKISQGNQIIEMENLINEIRGN
jgi:uncharacterized protein (DUF305 family)